MAVVGTARHMAIAVWTRQDLLWRRAGFDGSRASVVVATAESSIKIAGRSFRVDMIPREILKKIRQIELRTNHFVNA